MKKDETVQDFLNRGGKIYYAKHGESAYPTHPTGLVHIKLNPQVDSVPHPKRGKHGYRCPPVN